MVKRLWLVCGLALLVAACGSSEKGTQESSGAETTMPEASAPAAEAPEAKAPEAEAPAAEEPAATSEQLVGEGQHCLDLVKQGQFAQAVPVCTEALKDNPASDAVKQALSDAQAKAGEAASAAKEAAGQAEGAAGEAASKLPGASAPQQ